MREIEIVLGIQTKVFMMLWLTAAYIHADAGLHIVFTLSVNSHIEYKA